MAMSEITIAGAGIFGLSLAFVLLGRGAKVHVYDKGAIGQGASGGLVGALAPHTPDNWNDKKEFQFQSLLKTPSFWRDVDSISGLSSGYARTGRLQVVDQPRELENARLREEGAVEFWRNHAEWQVLGPGFDPLWQLDPGKTLVRDTLSALIAPRAAITSLAEAVRLRGGKITENAAAPENPMGPLVLANGYQGLIDQGLGNGQKGQGALLEFDARGRAQVFGDGIHIIPHLDGTVAVGSTSENDWRTMATDELVVPIIKKARTLCPELANARVIECWAGVRPRGRRRAPILGLLPGQKDRYIANGGFKIGFGVAVEAAERLADLVLEGRDTIPQSFRPEANL